ncbi:MAG: HEAT repeat domain-containing protein [Chloroflexi bacterium]|nr:HEAT repeat domain-containing protein [Chloroflexota bacterium]
MASRVNRRLSSLARRARRDGDDAAAEILEAVVASEQAHVEALLRAFALLQRHDDDGIGLHEVMGRLGFLGATKAVTALNKMVVNRSLDFGTRSGAIQALRMIGSRRAVPTLVSVLLEDEHDWVRSFAANALSLIADPRAKAALYQIATDKDAPANVRGDAIEALTHHADDRRIPVLLEALHDPSAEVRFWAVLTLGQVGGPDVLPELERLEATDDEVVPHWWSVGREARDAIEAIRARTEGNDNPV